MAKNRDDYRVLSTQSVDPIQLVLTESFRGRSRPVEEDEVVALADSLRSQGQQQPIKVRGLKDRPGTFEVLFGNTRARAGLLIKNGYKTVDGANKPKDIPPDPEFKLRVEVVDATDEQAFISNIVENAIRNQCTPIDTALNQEELRTTYAMTDAAIARLYGWSGSAGVNRLKKLLNLPKDIQNLIHMGTLSASSGHLLATCDDVAEANAYDKVIALAKQDGEKSNLPGVKGDESGYTAQNIAEAVKAWRKQQSEVKAAANGQANVGPSSADSQTSAGSSGDNGQTGVSPSEPTPVTRVPKTLKQVRQFISDVTGDGRTPPKTRETLVYFQSFIEDSMTDEQVVQSIMRLFDEHPLPVSEVAVPPAEAPPAEAPPAEAPLAEGRRRNRAVNRGATS